MNKFKKFLALIGSYCIAILRLLLLEVNLFFSALNIILFNRVEIANIELKGVPFRCDKQNTSETMAYLDKLCLENPDLLDIDDGEYPNDLDEGDEFPPPEN